MDKVKACRVAEEGSGTDSRPHSRVPPRKGGWPGRGRGEQTQESRGKRCREEEQKLEDKED